MTTSAAPRRARTRRRHGLGREGVDALLAQQRGSCAVCGVPYADTPGQRLAIDHDHGHCPGKIGCPVCIRGLLCNRCNNLLRLASDNSGILRIAASYLDKWERELATRPGER